MLAAFGFSVTMARDFWAQEVQAAQYVGFLNRSAASNRRTLVRIEFAALRSVLHFGAAPVIVISLSPAFGSDFTDAWLFGRT